MNSELAPLLKLGRAERIQLVEDIWDSIVEEKDTAGVSVEKRDELRERKARFLNDPSSGKTWEEVKARARSQE
jgi:putative addiction module component (TIGR02574 family)